MPDSSRLQRIARMTEDGWFRTTLVTTKAGLDKLFLDNWMRDAAGASVGDEVDVWLRSDGGSRELTFPALLQDELKEDAEARKAWNELPPSQREVLTYLNFLKSDAALHRNVEKVMKELRASR